MYRTYELTEKEKESKWIIQHWDGDCCSYTICEDYEEYLVEQDRLRKINEEHQRAYEEAKRNGVNLY